MNPSVKWAHWILHDTSSNNYRVHRLLQITSNSYQHRSCSENMTATHPNLNHLLIQHCQEFKPSNGKAFKRVQESFPCPILEMNSEK